MVLAGLAFNSFSTVVPGTGYLGSKVDILNIWNWQHWNYPQFKLFYFDGCLECRHCLRTETLSATKFSLRIER